MDLPIGLSVVEDLSGGHDIPHVDGGAYHEAWKETRGSAEHVPVEVARAPFRQ